MQKNLLKIVFHAFSFLLFSNISFAQNAEKARGLAKKFIIVDGHVDLPYRLKIKNFRLEKSYTGIPVSSKDGDFDFKRAQRGGLDAPFMSIYIPAELDTPAAQLLADSLINMVKYIATQKSKYFEIAKTPAEIFKIVNSGRVALPMGMENGSPIGTLADVAVFRKKGISYITLTHAKDNRISDSSYDTTGTHKGLSEFGKDVVRTMAKEGILIDVSHISDRAFYQVMEVSPVPVIASHSSARFFTPGFERNMDDEMIRRMGKNGGVIMVNFGSTFLDGEVAKFRKSFKEEIAKLLKEKELEPSSHEASLAIDEFFDQKKAAFSDIKMVANHIDHIVKLAGINHVGLGSDFDGVGNMLPVGLKDVSDYPKLIEELLDRGYQSPEIQKICSGNLFRVWYAALEYAEKN
jgi:membrane dipeptidase